MSKDYLVFQHTASHFLHQKDKKKLTETYILDTFQHFFVGI